MFLLFLSFSSKNNLIYNKDIVCTRQKSEKGVKIINTEFSKFSSNILSSSIQIEIYDSKFTNSNGGIIISQELMKFRDSRLVLNNSTNKIKNTVFDTIITVESGGAVSANESKVYFEDCCFSDNQGNSGGACFIKSGSLAFMSSNFTNCFALDIGGALSFHNSAATIESCNFLVCGSESTGGGISSLFTDLELISCMFFKCFSQVSSAMFVEGRATSLEKTFFIKNECSTIRSASISVYGANITLHECVFANNTANGEIVSIEVSKGKVFIENSVLDDKNIGGPNYIVKNSKKYATWNVADPTQKERSTLNVSCQVKVNSNEVVGYTGLILIVSYMAYKSLMDVTIENGYIQTETMLV